MFFTMYVFAPVSLNDWPAVNVSDEQSAAYRTTWPDMTVTAR